MIELLEILNGIKADLLPLLGEINEEATAITETNINCAIAICIDEIERNASPEIQNAVLRGKVEAYEKMINVKSHNYQGGNTYGI